MNDEMNDETNSETNGEINQDTSTPESNMNQPADGCSAVYTATKTQMLRPNLSLILIALLMSIYRVYYFIVKRRMNLNIGFNDLR